MIHRDGFGPGGRGPFSLSWTPVKPVNRLNLGRHLAPFLKGPISRPRSSLRDGWSPSEMRQATQPVPVAPAPSSALARPRPNQPGISQPLRPTCRSRSRKLGWRIPVGTRRAPLPSGFSRRFHRGEVGHAAFSRAFSSHPQKSALRRRPSLPSTLSARRSPNNQQQNTRPPSPNFCLLAIC